MRVTKFHIIVANISTRVIVLIGNNRPVELEMCQKCGRSIKAKYKNSRKRTTISLRESPKEKPHERGRFQSKRYSH